MKNIDFSTKKATLLALSLTLPCYLGLINLSRLASTSPKITVIAPLNLPEVQDIDESKFNELNPIENADDVESQPLNFAAVAKASTERAAEVLADSPGSELALVTNRDAGSDEQQVDVDGDLEAPSLRLKITPYEPQMIAKLTSEGLASVILGTSQGWYSATLTSGGRVAKIVPARTDLSKRSVAIPSALLGDATNQFDRLIGFYEIAWVKLVLTQELDNRLHQFSLAHPEVKEINLVYKDSKLVLEKMQ